MSAWKNDPAGAVAGSELATKQGWKIGDKLIIEGGKFPVNLELNLRGIFKSPFPINAIYFNWKNSTSEVEVVTDAMIRSPLHPRKQMECFEDMRKDDHDQTSSAEWL